MFRYMSVVWLLGALAGSACSESTAIRCEIPAGAPAPDFAHRIGCEGDFAALASDPLDASISGARSVKVVLDRRDGDALYFQNSVKYKIHYAFASDQLSHAPLPPVGELVDFNRVQYSSNDRRFVLGALTYYDGPKIWALEIAPYDTATAAMITLLYDAVRKAFALGAPLTFHPTSQGVQIEAAKLPARIPIKTTDDIFAATDYQPLNTGETVGLLRFVPAADLASVYVGIRDVVVLDMVPNDISATAGIISEEFQTPLSHINVLARNRGTPNMGLRMAMSNPALRALEGKWVDLVVGPFEYTIREATTDEADQFWEAHKPTPVTLPELDKSVTDLRDVHGVVVEGAVPLRTAIETAIRAFGAKTAGYSVLSNTDGVPSRPAFGIPVYYYVQFMEQNGFYDRVNTLLADPEFLGKPEVRDAALAKLRADIAQAPIDAGFQALLRAKLDADFPGLTLRFRSSTNAEDLDGFPCAGCYDSHTGDPANWDEDLLLAIRQTWATVWNFRTFEERSIHSIDHTGVGMALLVHQNFSTETANGVAVTANPFDPSGLEPAFYVNVQYGGTAEVVHPPAGAISDEFLYDYTYVGQPLVYLSHSNLIPKGMTVLSLEQTLELGMALAAIHKRFSPAYGPESGNTGFYGMDIEFKFDGPPEGPATLYVKQARPYPGMSQ